MTMLYIAIGVVSLLVSVQAYNKGIMDLYLQRQDGHAVYYGKSQEGTCSYGSELPPVATGSHIKYLVGLNSKGFQNAIGCGMCLRVRATGLGEGDTPVTGDFVAFVHSECGGCEEGGIDLAEDGDGKWGIEFEAVQCPVEDGAIEYKFSGSDEWYLRLQVRNVRVPVQQVDLVLNGQEEPMTHTSDGYWEFSNRKVSPPLQIKLTAVTDEVIHDVIRSIDNDAVIQGDNWAQFEFDWGLPGV